MKKGMLVGIMVVVLGSMGCYERKGIVSCKVCYQGKCGETPDHLRATTEQEATEEAIIQLRLGQGVDDSGEEFKKVVPVCQTTDKWVPSLICSPH